MHHNAGLAGMGGSSYIDGVILQDADEAGDSTLETRTYTLQNWRADVAVAAKVGTSGAFVCRGYVVYEAYGKAVSYPLNSADFNGDDGVDDLDNTAFFDAFGNGDPEADLNLDDAIDDLDITAWNAIFQSGVTKEPGSGALSGLLVGYAGYMRDGFDDNLYHVRHRVYDTELGRWTRRDPLGYVDGMSVYGYVASRVIIAIDPWGHALYVPPDSKFDKRPVHWEDLFPQSPTSPSPDVNPTEQPTPTRLPGCNDAGIFTPPVAPIDGPCAAELSAFKSASEAHIQHWMMLSPTIGLDFFGWVIVERRLWSERQRALKALEACRTANNTPGLPGTPQPGLPAQTPIVQPNPCLAGLDGTWPPVGYGDSNTDCFGTCERQAISNLDFCNACSQAQGAQHYSGCVDKVEESLDRCVTRCLFAGM